TRLAACFLMGIPGLEDSYLLLSILFSIMYVLSLLGNSIMVLVISTNESLHQAMYIFLMMLSISDVFLSSTTLPKTLSIFLFHVYEISFYGCLTQVFFIHFIFGVESAILFSMAYDRYCAICHPLNYTSIVTGSFIKKAAMFILFRDVLLVFPLAFLLDRLSFQQSNVIEHTYCEHMSVAKLATVSITVNMVYGLMIIACASFLDFTLIVVSYVAIIIAVLRLRTSEARYKAFNTCVSHICVIILFYTPAFFSFIAHRVGHKYVSLQFHILLANLYTVVPPMMNPIIYGIKTREIQHKVVAMLRRPKHFIIIS
ncbi:olfactory receptor 52D1-like, partial [Hyperolius riggenbachi]|uniref:olfactory receptor 52D1-like n=1 Tax=Hyperolius riggenbachi TaxID=752182 RepID=UPI0035A2C91F